MAGFFWGGGGKLTLDVRDLDGLVVAERSVAPPGLVHLVLQAAVHHPELQLHTDDAEFSTFSWQKATRPQVEANEYLLVDSEGDGHGHKRKPAKDKRRLLEAKGGQTAVKVTAGGLVLPVNEVGGSVHRVDDPRRFAR